ncbi:MAG: AraC family transcriptional regulator [Nevskiaceae bacterium]|nr:MAG: AraC family transcriptional regulator [Nevskiaceae bacterium]TBR74795.1 MAG: AraC family transcriptional regulator [Nevskiaceae bacterium]
MNASTETRQPAFSSNLRAGVSIDFVREVVGCVESRGLPVEDFLSSAGIDLALLAQSDARVSVESFGQLWLAVARALDDELFGLDTRRMKTGTYAALARLAIQYPTLGGALRACAGWINLILDESAIVVAASRRTAIIEIIHTPRARPISERNAAFAHETLLVMLYGLACWLIDRHITLNALSFAWPRPRRAAEYDTIFAPGARFGAPATQLRFAASVLAAPIAQNAASLRGFLHAAPANFILRYRNAASPSAYIRHRLQTTPPWDWPSFAALACEMDTAQSTLHRQLAREGARFGAIRDTLRRDHAIRRLADGRTPIARIAEELGFAEPESFYRAFRKWTGARPSDYRRSTRPMQAASTLDSP